MLTGDKPEIATDVAIQSGLITKNTSVISLNEKDHNKLMD
jgi:magnesium-transporting ATPase (P-type)